MGKMSALFLLLALLFVGCGTQTPITVYMPSSTATPAPTATPQPTTTPAPTKRSGLTLVFDWHAGLGQECSGNCGRAYLHAPWKLAYRCPADPPGVGGYGLWFNLSSSNGTSEDGAHAPIGCTGGKQWFDDYGGMPSVGDGSWMSLDAASCPDPRPFDVAPSVYSCDIWIYQG